MFVLVVDLTLPNTLSSCTSVPPPYHTHTSRYPKPTKNMNWVQSPRRLLPSLVTSSRTTRRRINITRSTSSSTTTISYYLPFLRRRRRRSSFSFSQALLLLPLLCVPQRTTIFPFRYTRFYTHRSHGLVSVVAIVCMRLVSSLPQCVCANCCICWCLLLDIVSVFVSPPRHP